MTFARCEPPIATPSTVETAPTLSAAALYSEHVEFVWRNARRLGADDEWVEDAVHEIFLVATRRFAEFEGRSSVRTWLFGIALRVVKRMRRDRARHARRLDDFSHEPSVSRYTEPDERWQSAQYLRELLGRLSEAKRIVIVLAELEDLTSAEIARELGVPQGTIDSRLRAARRDLTRMIERDRARERRQTR